MVVWLTDERCLALFPVGTNRQRSSQLRFSIMLWAGFEPAEDLSSGLVEWSCAVVTNTKAQCHYYNHYTTVLYVERLGYEFATIFVTFVCISYFTLQICVHLTRDTFLVSREKKVKKFAYFYKTSMCQCSIF